MSGPITQAALFIDNQIATLPRPARHCDIWAAYKGTMLAVYRYQRKEPPEMRLGSWMQGFIDASGEYHNRETAAAQAFALNQISERKPQLFSEDLW